MAQRNTYFQDETVEKDKIDKILAYRLLIPLYSTPSSRIKTVLEMKASAVSSSFVPMPVKIFLIELLYLLSIVLFPF